MNEDRIRADRLGGRELVTLDPFDCPLCGHRILGRAPHEGTGPCRACLADPDWWEPL